METVDTQVSAFKLGKPDGKVNSSTRIKKEPKEMKTYHETCQKCNRKVSSRAMFCGHCGYVQIKNDLIHESSTSVYDPGDRSVRPWREQSIVAKNHWKSRVKKVQVGKREPWRPTMRQARVNKRIIIGLPSLVQKGSGKGINTTAPPEITAHERRKQYDEDLMARKVEVRYRGRVWRREGEERRRKNAIQEMPSGLYTAESVSDMSSFKREVPDEESFPLAVFAVDWMTVSTATEGEEREERGEGGGEQSQSQSQMSMTIHFSLYQHVMESEDLELETNKVQRWLRVGYLLENEAGSGTGTGTDTGSNSNSNSNNNDAKGEEKQQGSGTGLEDSEAGGGTLKILDFIPNAVAKCMGVRESDWVDLDYIDPKNEYMVGHLQHSLVQIARRVVSRLQNSSTTFDQNSSVVYADSTGAEVFNHGHEKDEDEDGGVGYVPSGSYSRSVKAIRKLVSREDASLVVVEEESGSDYIRRHLEGGWSEDEEEDKGGGVQESSSDFILRHLAEAEAEEKGGQGQEQGQKKQDDDKRAEGESESSSEFIRRHLAEAGMEDEQQQEAEEKEKERRGQREASELYREYQAKCSEERDLRCCSGRAGGQRVEPDDLTLEDTVAQISASISLGAFYLNKRINTKVWMSVHWNHADGIDQSIKFRSKFNPIKNKKITFDYNSISSCRPGGDPNTPSEVTVTGSPTHPSLAATPAPATDYDDVDFLARKPLVENITLKLFPMYYDEADMQPKMVHFSTWSLTVLLDMLSVRAQMVSSNEVHIFESEQRLSSIDVSAYVLFCLSKGASGAHELCRTLTKCLRYEHTTEGVRVFVNGVENDFVLCTSPEERKLQLLENKYACVLIQCCFRKAIANRKFRNLVRKDRIKRQETMQHAAIEIQRIARGYIERSMVKALLLQLQENEAKERLLAEAEARDKILFCVMNNTDVEIVAHCGGCELDGEGAVMDLTEMIVRVTDVESRNVTSLTVNHTDLGRIWALYISTFIKKSLNFDSITDVFNNLKARKKMLFFMADRCLELFLSRKSGFMKLSLRDLCQYIISVTVTIMSAKDLVNADAVLGGRMDVLLGGKSDPYVLIKLGEEHFKTKTIKNNLNPEFNEEFTFHKWNRQDDILLDVMDKDLISKDDLLGKGIVPLTRVGIPSVEPINLDLPLRECKHGSLQLEISCTYSTTIPVNTSES